MTKEDQEEMALAMSRADRMRRFLVSREWLEDIQPMLAREQNAADVKRSYHPQISKGLDEPALFRAYFAGAFDFAEQIPKMVRDAIQKGEEAERDLKAYERKEALR